MIIFAIAALAVSQTASEIEAKFANYSLETDTLQIKARLFIPESYDSAYPYPVVLTLHGLGECGSNNTTHVLNNHVATTWGTDEFQAENPCFIFSPQCPLYMDWTTPSVYQAVMVLLDSLINTYYIDTSRIYITGLSLGGSGTWSYLGFDPNKYAAAIPVCGISGGTNIQNIKHIPVWNFHGNLDDVINVTSSRSVIKKYIRLGEYPLLTHHFYRMVYDLPGSQIDEYITNHTDLIYSEVPDIGHNVWDVAYQTPEAKRWLFKQRKRTISNLNLEKQGDIIDVSGDYKFELHCPEIVKEVSVWLGHVHSCDWLQLDSFNPSSGQYVFDSRITDDHPFALLKFLAHDSLGYVIGKEYSDILCINNEDNGLPYIEILNDPTIEEASISMPILPLELQLGDPEDSTLLITVSISTDDGLTFEPYSTFETKPEVWTEPVHLEDLFMADQMVIRVEVSDGEHSVSAETLNFKNTMGNLNVSIPDSVFLQTLLSMGVDKGGDGFISLIEAYTLTSLSISGLSEYGQIQDLKGIEAFVNLENLELLDHMITKLDLSNNTKITHLRAACRLESIDISKCTKLKSLQLQKGETELQNNLVSLDISNNSALEELNIAGMPELHEVCVWTLPFPPDGTIVDTSGSPNVCFELDCNGDCSIEITLTASIDTIFQPINMEATSSEDGMIYLVPMDTNKDIGVIRGACLDSVIAVMHTPITIPLEGMGNGTYWLYATDTSGNISEPTTFTIMGVGIEQRSSENLRIYPNPIYTILTIETVTSDLKDIEITSLNGQLVLNKEMEGTTYQLDLSILQKGVYFITIRSKDFVTTRKIVKL